MTPITHIAGGLQPVANRVRALSLVAGVCGLVQALSATFLVPAFDTPNASSSIARSIVHQSRFVYPETGSVAFQLPGEPLVLAAGFRFLPEPAWPYLHVPVTVLLVSSIADAAFTMGGPTLAIAAGTIAALDPFTVVHGPVWDDTWLAAALEWLIFAILLRAVAGAAAARVRPTAQSTAWLLVAACAGGASLTRLQSQLVLGCVAVAAVTLNQLQPIRSLGWALVVGVSIALGGWGLRNAIVTGHFFVGTTHDGKTLDESTGPNAWNAIMLNGQAGGSGAPTPSGDEVEADRALMRRARSYIAHHPQQFVRTALLKTVATVLGIDLGRTAASPRNVVALVTSILLLASGSYGLFVLGRTVPYGDVVFLARVLAIVSAAITFALIVLGPVGLRYRTGLTNFLYLGAAVALARSLSGPTHGARRLQP